MARLPLMSGWGRLLAEADAGCTAPAVLVGGCAAAGSAADGCDLLQPTEAPISKRTKIGLKKKPGDFILPDIVNGNCFVIVH